MSLIAALVSVKYAFCLREWFLLIWIVSQKSLTLCELIHNTYESIHACIISIICDSHHQNLWLYLNRFKLTLNQFKTFIWAVWIVSILSWHVSIFISCSSFQTCLFAVWIDQFIRWIDSFWLIFVKIMAFYSFLYKPFSS